MNRGGESRVCGRAGSCIFKFSASAQMGRFCRRRMAQILGEHHNRIHATLKIEAKIHVNPSNKPSKVI